MTAPTATTPAKPRPRTRYRPSGLRVADIRARGWSPEDYPTPAEAGQAAHDLFADQPHHQKTARRIAYGAHPVRRAKIADSRRRHRARSGLRLADIRARGWRAEDYPDERAAGEAARDLFADEPHRTSHAYSLGYNAHPNQVKYRTEHARRYGRRNEGGAPAPLVGCELAG